MTLTMSIRDTLLVARFEVLRAIRTWRALALIVAYVVANLGGCWIFIQAIAKLEEGIAETMGVAVTRWPGTLMEQVRQSEQMVDIVTFFVGGGEAQARALLGQPVLAIFQLWLALLLVPFMAATTSSECVAIDVGSRAIRYEALRTGRAELVAGRFLGQLLLTSAATAAALLGVWVLGMTLMVAQPPVGLALGLLWLGPRSIAWSVPFVGMGMAASQLTASPAWARVLALVAAAGSYVVFGICSLTTRTPWVWVADVIEPLLPQTWQLGLWDVGPSWLGSGAACAGLGAGFAAVGYLRFAARDL
ncbi:MAG TPA: hypothetical protein PKA64_21465 [Myxococcota bacterium]|nr:hypothetical protein [Myxococcota bacterium]